MTIKKTAIVTGAGSGLGRHITVVLAEAGAVAADAAGAAMLPAVPAISARAAKNLPGLRIPGFKPA